MKKNTLIGQQVTTKEGNTITIKSEKVINDEYIYSDTEGNIYTEDELIIYYRIAPHRLLYNILIDNGIKLPKWNGDKWEKIFDDFMNIMEYSGYISKSKN